MNNEYLKKLKAFGELANELMCFKLASESPNVHIVSEYEGRHHNILLAASDFADKEVKRIEETPAKQKRT